MSTITQTIKLRLMVTSEQVVLFRLSKRKYLIYDVFALKGGDLY